MKTVKSIFAIALLLVGLSIGLKAQNSDANVTKTKIVNASADDVWDVIRQMDDIDVYSSFVGSVDWTGDHGIGGQRVCYPPEGQEGGTYTEQVVEFSDAERTYSYALVAGVPAQGMVNSFKVIDLGYKKSMIVWTSTYEAFMENPQMDETQFIGFLNQAIGETIVLYAAAAEKM